MSSLSDRIAAATRAGARRREAEAPAADGSATTEAPGQASSAGDAASVPPQVPAQAPPSAAAAVPAAAQAAPAAPVPTEAETARASAANIRAKDRLAEVKDKVHRELLAQLGPELYEAGMEQTELEARVRTVLGDLMRRTETPLSGNDRAVITQSISDDILGYGPIEEYLRDDEVSEVMVNGPRSIWLERKGRLEQVESGFKDEAHLRRIIDKIVSQIGRRVDESSPMVDARLPDGSRVNAVVPPLALDGSALTIRKFAADPLTVEDLISFGSLSRATADFLDACVRGRLNMIVSGGTGAGKTTTLNVLSSFIPGDERIVTIEDAAELQLKQEHVVRLESRPANIEGKGAITIRDLVKNSLRMRPDRIIVGEVRDASALDMLQAMNTGHDGSICSLHSNGPRDTLARMETMVLMAGMDLPMRAIREQVASAVDLIVHQARLKDGSRHITHITEVERMEGDVITLQDVFVYDHSAGFDAHGRSMGRLRSTGLRPKFLEKMAHANVTVDASTFAPDAVI